MLTQLQCQGIISEMPPLFDYVGETQHLSMPSFTISNKLVHAFQLFDEDNPLHKSDNKYIFTTEGHVVPIDKRFREKRWNDLFPCEEGKLAERKPSDQPPPSNISNVRPSIILPALRLDLL